MTTTWTGRSWRWPARSGVGEAMRPVWLETVAGVALVLSLTGCGGANGRRTRIEGDQQYAAAERAFSNRQDDLAERLFLDIAATQPTPEVQALAAYRRGQMRERAGQTEAALVLYAEAEGFQGTERAAFGAWRKARLVAQTSGRAAEGNAALRRVIDTHPDASAADKAVKYLAVGRPGSPHPPPERAQDQETVDWMLAAAERLSQNTVGDNLLFYAAWMQVNRLGDIGGARTTLRRLATRYYVSPLLDDGLWLLATLERRQGRVDAALEACEALLRVRVDQDYLIGGYRGRRLDDAALAVGLMQLHLRRDLPAAERAFRRILDEFPTTVFRDDAYWGLAVSQAAQSRDDAARETLRALLRELPDSRFTKDAQAVLDGRAALPGPELARATSALLNPMGRGSL